MVSSGRELKERLHDYDLQGLFLSLSLENNDAIAFVSVTDDDNTGWVDISEFVAGRMRLKGPVRNVDFVKSATETRGIMERLAHILWTSLKHDHSADSFRRGVTPA